MTTNSERMDEGEEEQLDIRLRQDEEMEFFTELALHEAERWISAVTRKKFAHPDDFRKSLENGVLLCELLNCLKPRSVKRINKLPGAIAGLDNINVFLKSCRETFGLGSNQLFDIGDLEDLSQRAIADSDNLKQEVSRRSLNVAIAIFWLGRSVSQTFSGPQLDQSAFSAIVHYSGKDLLPKERHRNDSVDSSDQTSSAYSSHETNSRVSNEDSLEHKHIRDSSCDSFVSKESIPSVDLEDENMPGSVTSKMRRYNSAGSLNTSGGYHFSATSNSINVDDYGHTNSNHHRRGSSTDSMDSSSYLGNHSRQSSDSASVDIPTRTLKTQRKVSSSTLDPLQFVKSKPADSLAKTAQEQIEAAKETKISRVVIPEKDDVDWQSNLNIWKHRRRRASAATYQRIEETDSMTQEEEEKKSKPKTYNEMMSERKKRMSTGMLNFYPMDDDDDDLFSKKSEPLQETIQKTEQVRQETAPSVRLQQRLSLKNRTNSFGSEKSSYEEKNIADWAKDDDDQNNTNNAQDENSVEEKTGAPRTTHDDKFNRGKVSESKKSLSGDSSWRTQAKQDSSTANRSENSTSSVNKISNILKSFEKKEQVDYEKPKKKFEFSVGAGRTRSKWQEMEKKETHDSPPVRLADRPRAKSHPAKDFTEKNIKINLQSPHNSKGFGFSIAGGVEKKQPITVYKVTIGSAADVCDLQMKDIILAVNRRDTSTMTNPQVQHIIDNSVRHGHLELRIKREAGEEYGWPDIDDDDIDDEAFEEKPASPQNHSPIWKSPALAPNSHSPKTSTSPSTSPGYHYKHTERSTPGHQRHSPKSTLDHHKHTDNQDHHKHTDNQDHNRHNDRWTSEYTRKEEKADSNPSYYQRHRDTAPTVTSKKTEKVPPPVPEKRTPALKEDVKLEVAVSATKWEPPQQEPRKPVSNTTADEEPMWIMDKLKAEHRSVKHSPVLDTRRPETNNNDVKQESESESESEEEEEEEELREEESPQIETAVIERPTITVRKNKEIKVIEPEPPVVLQSSILQEPPPPPPPSEAPPPLKPSNLGEEIFKPPDILRRWQKSSRSGRSSSSNSLDSDADKRLSSSSLQAEFNINQTSPSHVEMDPSKEPQYDAKVGQPVTLQISTSHLIIDPRNQNHAEDPVPLPEYSFHVNLDQPKETGSVLPSPDLNNDQKHLQEEEEKTRIMKEKEEQLRKQEEEIRKEREKLRLEQEKVQREREALERQKHVEEKPKYRLTHDNKREMNGYDKPSDNVTQFSVSQETSQGPRRLETLWAPDPNKDKQRWSREDMMAMNRKPTPLQKKPEPELEPESSKEVQHSNSVPKSRPHSGDHIQTQIKPHRSEHHNLHSHWMVEEAERRRRAENKRHSVHSYGGPIKPVHQEGVANRWRDDTSVPKQQTYSTNSVISPRSLDTKQFSAVNEPDKLSHTLPANYSYSHAPKSDNSLRPSKSSPNPPSPTSPPSHAEQIMAVSGKQLCSHCAQELGFGAAMVIESLGLYYHVQCFRCCVCHTTLGNGSQGADVRVRVNKLHCRNCYSNDEAGLKFSKV
ncbi:LIM and calponin homology domains-containing protein 1-like isoform X4 [Ostrea edulis]|uniref:LIM and calponin homology domains-containing protein 1-like isoform X4 n=1 Tax=Ostrea edulis TaxID=37623 RepID=UPI0024AEF8BE|nr:LIM and calponin homology domains-containing protein 1-like isoform X4 [Ostrea edulis]